MPGRILFVFILLAAGVATAQQTIPAERPCTEPRPQICPMLYNPVCGATAQGAKKTYASGCEACADKAVISHVPGVCS
jgi:hypothetical protein